MDDREFYERTSKLWRPDDHTKGLGPCLKCMIRPAVTFHHIEPRSMAPERVYDINNVIPLCHKCHEWAEEAGEAGRILLKARLRERLKTRKT